MPRVDDRALRLDRITFGYDAAPAPLFEELTLHLPSGWTGVVGANGSGKTTLLLLATADLAPQRGSRQGTVRTALYCQQRTDDPPARLGELIAEQDPLACQVRGELGIGPDWLARWDTLSHGERKRAQLGVALWLQPDLLAIDEPTNHIDADARRVLLHALRRFDGVGLLVSHDRELLDGLCRRCVFVDPRRVTLRPGGYSAGAAEARREARHAASVRRELGRQREALGREARRRKKDVEGSRGRVSKRRLHRKDSDGRARVDLAQRHAHAGRAAQAAGRHRHQPRARADRARRADQPPRPGLDRVSRERAG